MTVPKHPKVQDGETMRSGYRRDIDGLRALAVLPVFLYHAGLAGFAGGFVGVDVFFVISGFLITGIVLRDIEAGTFSLLAFYERRARRILPALLVMMLVVMAVGYLVLLPDDYDEAARSAISAVFSMSNFFFYDQAGYFSSSAIFKPLLHTWSLGVEEQFYLLFPLLLVVLSRRRGGAAPAICAIAAVSLIAAIVITPIDRLLAFYLLPSRAWELLVGALLAMGLIPQWHARRWREAGAWVGLLLLVGAVFSFGAETPFPGPGAVLPVLGAALLIHCAPGTSAGRIVGSAPLRGIGLISYSLYLWHWPVIVFTDYIGLTATTFGGVFSAIGLSLFLAFLSWCYVERPFRQTSGLDALPIWRSAIASGVACVLASLAIARDDGMPQRFGAAIAQFDPATGTSPVREKCHDDLDGKKRDFCELGYAPASPSVAVWGDSHGVGLSYALGEIGSQRGFSLLQMTGSSCPAMLDRSGVTSRACQSHNKRALTYLQSNPAIKTVVLTTRYGFDLYDRIPGFSGAILNSIDKLRAAGKSVIVVGPTPELAFDAPRALAFAAHMGRPGPAGMETEDFLRGAAGTLRMLATAQARGAKIVRPDRILCPDDRCDIVRDGKMLYLDGNHLSLTADRMVAAQIAPLLALPPQDRRAGIISKPMSDTRQSATAMIIRSPLTNVMLTSVR